MTAGVTAWMTGTQCPQNPVPALWPILARPWRSWFGHGRLDKTSSLPVPAPRRSRRRKGQEEPDQFNPVQWPELKAQQALQARMEPAELALAQERCKTLLAHGYGPLMDWLLSDPTPAERSGQQGLDLFDQAG